MKRSIQLISACILALAAAAAGAVEPGDVVGRHIFGLATDYQGDPAQFEGRSRVFESVAVETRIEREAGDLRVSLFDADVGGLYLTDLDPGTGEALDTRPVDLAPAGGLSAPGMARIAPWGSVLIGETRPVDGRDPAGFAERFAPYFKGKVDMADPYHHGWPAELVLLETGDQRSKVIRDYAMGRVFAGDLAIMPDGRTVYMVDRGLTGHLYLFIADRADSLSAGTLYLVGREGGEVVHHLLGRGSALALRMQLRRVDFPAIFASAERDGGACPADFRPVDSVFGRECLRLEKRLARFAGLFEPQRFAAYRGYPAFAAGIDRLDHRADAGRLVIRAGEETVVEADLGAHPDFDSQFIIQGL